ncbi:MAG: iron-containing alcohol dehydrogenase [Oscillospiraceae bacterium]|nr:iron-containing alcohol dehydrogenase [Oscillospiraceae bacterium]
MFLPKAIFCRVFQTAFRLALPVLPYREPVIINSCHDLGPVLKKENVDSVLIVTDAGIVKNNLTSSLEKALENQKISYTIYDKTQPNPTVKNVEEAFRLYNDSRCSVVIAVGGGSAMDCAKAVGARVAYPSKTVGQMKGVLRVLKKTPLLVAVPTTAGTGSEVTLAAVITDDEKHDKYAIMSFPLIPSYAVLDATLTYSLPPHLTSTTGMDALTHAVEAYLGRSTTAQTRKLACEAIKLVFENIETAYNEGNNYEARQNMLLAAYKAGEAFSKSYVGYIHGIAHSLGGKYGIPHGLANAVIMPYVLDGYGEKVYKKLHHLGVVAGVCGENDSIKDGAEKFIAAIRQLNRNMSIPEKLQGIIKEDISEMAAHAEKESNPLYPVPVLMTAEELEQFYYKIADWNI